MSKFKIEQYEIHSQTYIVEAETKAEAVLAVLDGKADFKFKCDGPKYIQVDFDHFQPDLFTDEELEQIENSGNWTEDTSVPSIRNIEEIV